MSPVAGLVRLRKHQFGRQAALGTVVAATDAYPFKGVPTVDPGWTDPDVDAGTLDPTAAPYRTAGERTASLTDASVAYNTIPLIMCGFFGGAVSPTGAGTAQTWVHDPDPTVVEEMDPFTYEFGDDVLTDWWQLGDGIVESAEFTGSEGLGPLTGSYNWRFGSQAGTGYTDFPVTGSVPTPGLAVDTNATIIYLKDIAIYIADSVAGLGAGKINKALHNFTLRFSGDIDEKRYAEGDQTFDIDEYARATRVIELEATYAKKDQIVGTGSEADDWNSEQAVTRYVRILATSLVLAQAPGTYYSWEIIMPMRYYTRTDGELGGNATVTLLGRAFYDPSDFTGVFRSTVVCTRTEAELGEMGS